MGRPPLEKKQRQLAVALPDDVRQRLEAAAARSGGSLAEEIRRRLVASFDAEAHDADVRDLAEGVMWMAEELKRQAGVSWHSTRKAREALSSAIQTWLEISAPPQSPAAEDLFGPDDPPTLGRSIARHYQRQYSEIMKAIRILRGERP